MTVMRNEFDVAKAILQVATDLNEKGKSYIQELTNATVAMPFEAEKRSKAAQELIDKADVFKSEIKKQQDAANEQLAQRERAVKVREATMEQLNERKKEAEEAEAARTD